MVNFSVNDWVSDPGSPVVVAASIETYLETVDNSKTIYLCQVVQLGSALFQGVVIHTA
jgi:hypothetical protein